MLISFNKPVVPAMAQRDIAVVVIPALAASKVVKPQASMI
jgi:hypothetical protein